ncbi:hypothetical protein BDV93DRAFT_522685 [Ceratobasidium sp. AG-I]|nr:hypothetical protein BDV93DRAFT_522685 [Ceratobasidium sp. AG-I]
MSLSSPAPYTDSQRTSSAAHASLPVDVDTADHVMGKQKGKRQQLAKSLKRPTPQDFECLARDPSGNQGMLAQYIGTDSKYTLASSHATMMVRQSVRSSDFSHRLKEATISLILIAELVEFIHSQEDLKPEQRGYLALRMCFSALTALLGDFSSEDVLVNDPYVPIVTRSALGTFRQYYPPVAQVVARLVEKLAKSINMYRHRRSPSASVVTRFQGMLRTLETWRAALRDDTFQEPTEIIQKWFSNYPNQVGASQMRVLSIQPSIDTSETTPSLIQAAYNPALLPLYSNTEPMSQSHRSSYDNTRSSALQSSMINFGHQLPSYDTSTLFSSTCYPATTLPVSATDMPDEFTVLGSMYDDTYISPSLGQSSFYDSMYGYRQG